MKKNLEEKKAKAKAERKAKKAAKGDGSEKKRKREEIEYKPVKKMATISTSGATAAVMDKVAQDLAEKKKPASDALKSIFEPKNRVDNGNYLTKGTFNRY